MKQTIIDWQPAKTLPTETPGQYIIWLGGAHAGKSGRTLEVYRVAECANGFLSTVGGYMAYDYLDDECFVVAWAPAPDGPEEGKG